MIYTLGYREFYEASFDAMNKENQVVVKFGKNDSYSGGSVFRTYEDALRYRDENKLIDFDVYGVIALWEETEPNDHGLFHNLLADSRLVRLSDLNGGSS